MIRHGSRGGRRRCRRRWTRRSRTFRRRLSRRSGRTLHGRRWTLDRWWRGSCDSHSRLRRSRGTRWFRRWSDGRWRGRRCLDHRLARRGPSGRFLDDTRSRSGRLRGLVASFDTRFVRARGRWRRRWSSRLLDARSRRWLDRDARLGATARRCRGRCCGGRGRFGAHRLGTSRRWRSIGRLGDATTDHRRRSRWCGRSRRGCRWLRALDGTIFHRWLRLVSARSATQHGARRQLLCLDRLWATRFLFFKRTADSRDVISVERGHVIVHLETESANLRDEVLVGNANLFGNLIDAHLRSGPSPSRRLSARDFLQCSPWCCHPQDGWVFDPRSANCRRPVTSRSPSARCQLVILAVVTSARARL